MLNERERIQVEMASNWIENCLMRCLSWYRSDESGTSQCVQELMMWIETAKDVTNNFYVLFTQKHNPVENLKREIYAFELRFKRKGFSLLKPRKRIILVMMRSNQKITKLIHELAN